MTRIALSSGSVFEPQVVFMDCDGVIFDANPLKLNAFRVAVADAPADAIDDLLERHRQTGGISRYEKLRWFYEERLCAEAPDRAVEDALGRFAAASRAGYRRLTPRPEALRFAAALGGPARVYVVSGSDQTELRDVFSRHGIRDRFADVLGSPTEKPVHMRAVLQAHGADPTAALMVGDGRGDLDASRELGVPFVFLREMSEWSDAERHLEERDGRAPTWDALLACLQT